MRIFLTLLIGLLVLAPNFAAGQQQHYVGIMAGLNFADLGTKTVEGGPADTVPRTKFGVGGIVGFWLRDNVYFQIEPKYLQKGGKLLEEDPIPDLDFTFTYVEVPLLAKIVFGEKVSRYALFGPTFGFLLATEVEFKSGPLIYTADVKDITKTVDFGLGLGTGINLPLGKGLIFLDGRYAVGLTNINKGGTVEFKSGDLVVVDEISRNDKISTKGFQIILGYTLPIGGKQLAAE